MNYFHALKLSHWMKNLNKFRVIGRVNCGKMCSSRIGASSPFARKNFKRAGMEGKRSAIASARDWDIPGQTINCLVHASFTVSAFFFCSRFWSWLNGTPEISSTAALFWRRTVTSFKNAAVSRVSAHLWIRYPPLESVDATAFNDMISFRILIENTNLLACHVSSIRSLD